MASRRRPVVPTVPQPPPRVPVYPSWYTKRLFSDVQHSSHSLQVWMEHVRAGEMRLPRFQRPYVWTDEQVIRMFDSMIHGYHVGSLLLWERYNLPPRMERWGDVEISAANDSYAALVIDGQQRLGGIVMAAMSGRFWFDTQAGSITTDGPGPWRVPAADFLLREGPSDLLYWHRDHAVEHGLPVLEVRDAWLAMMATIEGVYLGAVRFPSKWTMDRVLESFRRLSTEGTRMDLADLEAGLARALEGGAS